MYLFLWLVSTLNAPVVAKVCSPCGISTLTLLDPLVFTLTKSSRLCGSDAKKIVKEVALVDERQDVLCLLSCQEYFLCRTLKRRFYLLQKCIELD